MSEPNQNARQFYEKEKAKKRKAIVSHLSDIQPEPVHWLWTGRIPLGKLTLISGDPGLGKSLLTITIAASVSKGFRWPIDKTEAPMGDVVLLSAEDDAADTIRPRLDAAQANCDRIYILQAIQDTTPEGEPIRTMFSFKRDLKAMEELLASLPDCRLVVIDPVSAYLDGTDSYNNADIRALLAPLADLAARYKVSIVLVSHLNKSGVGNALYRTMGTLAFVAAVRAAYIITKDQENPTRRLFMPAKNNLAADMGGLAYSIVEAENGAPLIAWENEPVSMTADEALAVESDDRSATDEAMDFLRELLADGPMKASEAQKEARLAGISEKPLRRAREKLGIKPRKDTFSGPWVWALSVHEDAQNSEDAQPKKEGILEGGGHLRSTKEEDLAAMAYLHENKPELFKQ